MTTELVELADSFEVERDRDFLGGYFHDERTRETLGEAAKKLRALASRAGGSEVTASPTFTMREIVQALTEHYKDQTGDQRQVPAAITAFETMQQLVRIIERNRESAAPEPGAVGADRV